MSQSSPAPIEADPAPSQDNGQDNAQKSPNVRNSKVGYQLRYLNTDVDIHQVITTLKQQEQGRFLLYGVAGSGKTLLGQYIARKLKSGFDLITASDILARYSGESENNIRGLFDYARLKNRVIMIDEIGYFLTDRRNISHSWETSIINELLTRLELFEGVFIGTTNFELDSYIDHAFYRRFDLKIKFGYLTPAQAKTLFSETLKRMKIDVQSKQQLITCYAELNRMTKLTPADFALASRKARFIYDTLTPERLLGLIKDEISIKPDVERRRIGF